MTGSRPQNLPLYRQCGTGTELGSQVPLKGAELGNLVRHVGAHSPGLWVPGARREAPGQYWPIPHSPSRRTDIESIVLDLFGEFSPPIPPLAVKSPARRYRVLVVWLSDGGELLGQVSRALCYRAAVRLWGRVLRGDTDVLDAEMFPADDEPPLPDGVRLLGALDARELVRVDRDGLFDPNYLTADASAR